MTRPERYAALVCVLFALAAVLLGGCTARYESQDPQQHCHCHCESKESKQ